MVNFILKLVCTIATIITLIIEIIIKIGTSIILIGYTIIVIICRELVSNDVNWDPMLRWRISDPRAYPITYRTSDILSEFVIQFKKNQK